MKRTSLTAHAPSMRDPDPDGAHKLAARVWHDEGSLIIRKASMDRMSWEDREFCKALGAKLYGKRDD
ncbi:MAG: hypothetical protein AAFY81_09700 [Pseudomonadota bacterium]